MRDCLTTWLTCKTCELTRVYLAYLASVCLFALCEGRPLAFCIQGQSWCSQKNDEILSVSGEVSKRHLVKGSGRWNNILSPISSEISTWMLKKMSRIRLKKFCENFREKLWSALAPFSIKKYKPILNVGKMSNTLKRRF